MGLRRGAAAWGCAGVQQRGAAQGRSSVGLQRAAVWGGAVVGGLCRGVAALGCTGAQLMGGRGLRGLRGGRAVGWCRGVACYLASHYEDVARKTQGN